MSCIPAALESERVREDLALIRDVSVKGALLFARRNVGVGEKVTLNLYLGKETKTPRSAAGRVVRSDRRQGPDAGVWQYELGVEFEQPITEYQAEIEELCRQQEAAGILKR